MAHPVRSLSDAERLDWLRLARTERVGPVTFRGLLQRYGNAGAALDALPELSRRVGRARPLTPPPMAAMEAELTALERLGGRLVAQADPEYPDLLTATDDAPPVIALSGRGDLLSRPCVALVGARNASGNGRRIADRLARDLAEAGLTIVSGLARGIDTAAHKGALEGGTAAVLAGGIDVPFPPENEALHARIAEQGVLLAESPPGTKPTARHFPRRNRIISGLSLATVVVEAAPRSGSLITARLAAEQGRQVCAIPGSPLDPRAQGCNGLIRGGAVLVQSAAEILEELAPLLGAAGMVRRPALAEPPESLPSPAAEIGPEAHGQVVECLSPTPTAVDEVLRDCQLSPATVFGVLLELELAGRIERHPGNRVVLVQP